MSEGALTSTPRAPLQIRVEISPNTSTHAPAYLPGDIVRGVIHLEVTRAVTCSSLTIAFQCEELCEFVGTPRSPGGGLSARRPSSGVGRDASPSSIGGSSFEGRGVLSATVLHIIPPNSQVELDEAKSRYPFSFRVPVGLPGTLEHILESQGAALEAARFNAVHAVVVTGHVALRGGDHRRVSARQDVRVLCVAPVAAASSPAGGSSSNSGIEFLSLEGKQEAVYESGTCCWTRVHRIPCRVGVQLPDTFIIGLGSEPLPGLGLPVRVESTGAGAAPLENARVRFVQRLRVGGSLKGTPAGLPAARGGARGQSGVIEMQQIVAEETITPARGGGGMAIEASLFVSPRATGSTLLPSVQTRTLGVNHHVEVLVHFADAPNVAVFTSFPVRVAPARFAAPAPAEWTWAPVKGTTEKKLDFAYSAPEGSAVEALPNVRSSASFPAYVSPDGPNTLTIVDRIGEAPGFSTPLPTASAGTSGQKSGLGQPLLEDA